PCPVRGYIEIGARVCDPQRLRTMGTRFVLLWRGVSHVSMSTRVRSARGGYDRNAPPFHSMSQVFSPSTDASTVLKSVDWPDFAECRALTRFSSRAMPVQNTILK